MSDSARSPEGHHPAAVEAGPRPRSRLRRGLLGLGLAALGALVLATLWSLVSEGSGELAVPHRRVEGGAPRARIQARDFAFTPQAVEAPAGPELVLVVSNAGLVHHTFTSPQLRVDVVLAPGASDSLRISAPRSRGRVPFFCRYHQAQGMQGFIRLS